MKAIKIKSIKDCEKLVEKKVSFKYGADERNGLIKSFYQEGKTIYFEILSDTSKCITHISFRNLLNLI